MRSGVILPSVKKRWLQITQPSCLLSARPGLKRLPITNSVEPPPMSTTRRVSLVAGRLCEAPIKINRASSLPPMISIGKPSAASARGKNSAALPATRNVCVATARTCALGNPCKRSAKRDKASNARSCAASVSILFSSSPAPRRTVSLIESSESRPVWVTRAVCRRKLLEPRSTAAITGESGMR